MEGHLFWHERLNVGGGYSQTTVIRTDMITRVEYIQEPGVGSMAKVWVQGSPAPTTFRGHAADDLMDGLKNRAIHIVESQDKAPDELKLAI